VTEVINPALLSGFGQIIPEMILGLAACALFFASTVPASRHILASITLGSLVLAGIWWALWPLPGPETEATLRANAFASPLLLDALSAFVRLLAFGGGAILVLLSLKDLQDRQAADYLGCLLVVVIGVSLTAAANDLITLFLALELVSIPTYVLLYLTKKDDAAQEAAIKYFLLSVFSSALLLFGFSYLYGMSGTTNIPALIEALSVGEPARSASVALIALVMVVAGLGFKITAVPFHYYAPDVYQGAPTQVAALLAFMPKVAGFTALLRLAGFVWAGRVGSGWAFGDQVPVLFWILSVVTMTLGNVLALLQINIKRLLAYSSVAHAGYMLIGIAIAYPVSLGGPSSSMGGIPAVLFYLVAYGSMTVGAFGVLAYLSTPQRSVETEDDLIGLSRSHPAIALLMAVFLLSLIGIPLTAGFAGKFLLFWGAMAESGNRAVLFRWLALVGVLNSAIGAFYYLRILSKIYLFPGGRPLETSTSVPALASLWLCAILTVVFGIRPGILLDETIHAAGNRSNLLNQVLSGK
jgi:NADH-quinone oxidoreductase subunit N